MLALRSRSAIAALGAALSAIPLAVAHEHHHDGPADNSKPIDSVLWLHIGVQATTWAVLFPLTMVLGLIRHRLHVPLASLSLLLTSGGYLLGHGHGGRSFPETAHGSVATFMIFYLAAQAAVGVYLKLHLKLGEKTLRPWLVFVHGVLGKTFPLVGWVQMIFGITTLQSWCFGGRLGQCLAHYIMGSAFQAYAVILLIMLKAGGAWLERRGHSQEFFDSCVITAWGIVNTFTEHQGGPWTHKDLQHTLMGVLWWAGGAAGIWTSRGGRRSIFPGIIIILTGWAMSGHAQALMISTMIHALFGYALMAAGAARIIEICFVLNDQATGSSESTGEARTTVSTGPERSDGQWYPIRAFQYLPPYLLVASGVLFMSATDEELRWVDGMGVDHVTWGLIDFSISLAIFFWINVLIDTYVGWGGRGGAARATAAAAKNGEVSESWGGTARGLYARLSTSGARQRTGAGVVPNGSGRPGEVIHDSEHEMAQLPEDGDRGIMRAQHVLADEDDAEDEDPFEDEPVGYRAVR